MEKYEYDIVKTMELIEDRRKDEYANLYTNMSEGYSKIYPRSNEDLKVLFKNFSVKDKNVLSVLASSDQVFASYYLGAKSVDTFDLNFLTEHYYYLRKWLIEYKLEYYPDWGKFKSGSLWIRELLDSVECRSIEEEIAYKYWSLYTKKIGDFNKKTIFRNEIKQTFDLIVDDINKMRDIIRSKDLKFVQEDISGHINKNKKYDVIILSNILEYCSFQMERLIRCRDNLFDILEDDGMIIATHLMDYTTTPIESQIFGERFDSDDFFNEPKDLYGRGYYYIKK